MVVSSHTVSFPDLQGDDSYTNAALDVRCPKVPFPNMEKGHCKNIWATYLQRPDGKSCDVIVSAKPRVGRISPPLMHISGVSNDFSTASGRWKLCETQDPNTRKQQRELVNRLAAEDHSTLLHSASISHVVPILAPKKDMSQNQSPENRRSGVFSFPRLRPATPVTTASAPSVSSPEDSVSDRRSPRRSAIELSPQRLSPSDHASHSPDARPTQDCNPAHTFDSFVEKEKLVDDGNQKDNKRHHRRQLMRWIRKRLETPWQKKKRVVAEKEAECKRQWEENRRRIYGHMYDAPNADYPQLDRIPMPCLPPPIYM
ncbi:hypothetical protein BDW02DRAFT_545114 [Decorospora gaudefroyi]|uniref:Uncharacterized protein n=1 Tax=Decorospora gaudefroyi TaxID=184978 RepID=A0A6A5KM23_9PLEO|nr:hypothetical protein BDW02DRAFT_545114 [Decorospora gaudefroyi]